MLIDLPLINQFHNKQSNLDIEKEKKRKEEEDSTFEEEKEDLMEELILETWITQFLS
jgi:hypothetical protein